MKKHASKKGNAFEQTAEVIGKVSEGYPKGRNGHFIILLRNWKKDTQVSDKQIRMNFSKKVPKMSDTQIRMNFSKKCRKCPTPRSRTNFKKSAETVRQMDRS